MLALTVLLLAAAPKPPANLENPCGKEKAPFKGGCADVKQVAPFIKAIGEWRAACDKGDREKCVALGEAYRDGALVPTSPEYAAALFQYACDGKEAIGCATLGTLYRKGLGVKADPKKAALLTELACTMGHALSCSNAGYLYERGEGVTRDAKKAYELYMKGCNLGEKTGCENAAIVSYGQTPK
ncbi:MAG: tetratricopeptide repeat protein [Myxococcaceae bacterium]